MGINVAKHHALDAVNAGIKKLMDAHQWHLVARAQDWRDALKEETCKPSIARKAVEKLVAEMENYSKPPTK